MGTGAETIEKGAYRFSVPLTEGVIISRKSRFLMQVDIDGVEHICHCPTTGRVGNIDLAGRPCLLSKSGNALRKTQYTVEAVSLNRPEDLEKDWIGINQNAVNRYVEYYLKKDTFKKMVPSHSVVFREQLLGSSRLDFLVSNTYLEVKTLLQDIQLPVPEYVRTKKLAPSSSIDRLIKHVAELRNSLQHNRRAIMLLVFMYDNPGFKVITRSKYYEKVRDVTTESFSNGVELWQANFKITPPHVSLDKYFRIDLNSVM